MFFQLCFKQFKQGKGIGGAAGETGQDLVLVKAPHLAGVAFHDGVAHRHLAVAANDYAVAAAHGQNGRTSELFHAYLQWRCELAVAVLAGSDPDQADMGQCDGIQALDRLSGSAAFQ